MRKNSVIQPNARQQAWVLHDQGWLIKQIADKLAVHPSTISRWLQRIKREGPSALRTSGRTGRPLRLKREQRHQLAAMLQQPSSQYGFWGDFWTLERIQQLIQREFDVTYSLGRVYALLPLIGYPLPRVPGGKLRQAKQRERIHAELASLMRVSTGEGSQP
ncbi:MAG: helix-turn-helix domain-containing protein [Caldilineaceae bacterium]